ncbi:MAG: endonuclease MutS2 [bacterium]
MDCANHTLEILEFPAVLGRVAEFALTPLGRERVAGLLPLDDLSIQEREVAKTKEMVRLMEEHREPPLGDLVDPRPLWAKAWPENACLEAEEFLIVARFLEVAGRMSAFFRSVKSEAPLLSELARRLTPLPEILKVIEQKIDPRGKMRDNATPRLHDLRRRIEKWEKEIHRRLNHLLAKLKESKVLQDDFFTQRGGRYCLPVRAGAKGRVEGIVHDTSQSGETLFLEPFEIVEAANELADANAQEREEVRRILGELTTLLRTERGALEINTEILGEFDFIFAKARFAERHKMGFPRIGRGIPLNLKEACHPLLYLQNASRCVPLSLRLEKGDRTLLISGPNTGGKTTALKTVGLMVLMAHSALPVPADDVSTIPFLGGLFADIGDEQSVTGGISSFSSHLTQIKTILEGATPESLVLLDEIGTATDPSEGGALAVAILERLNERDALTVATSHFSILKHWAHGHPHARNASFRLDEKTCRPSFHITMDVPGASEALVIARHIGLPADLLDRARAILPPGEEDVSSLIISLQKKETDLAADNAKLESRLAALEVEKAEAEKIHQQLREEKRTHRIKLQEEFERLVEEKRKELETRIAHLPSKRELVTEREALRTEAKEIRKETAVLASVDKTVKERGPALRPDELQPGVVVAIPELKECGVLRSFDRERGRAKVFLKNFEVEVAQHQLARASAEEQETIRARGGTQYQRSRDVVFSLDLHGMRVEEMVERVDKYLDDAVVEGLPYVKLVHGHGTGKLRKALHDFLKTHPHVERFRYGTPDEGGGAVTIVELKK